MEKKVCFRCKKPIEEKSNYYSFTEWNNKKIVKINYAHRICWDDFLTKLSSMEKAQNFLNRVNLDPLVNLGLMKPEEVVIK